MKTRSLYSFKNKIYSVLMIIALFWATVNLPFVYNAQQEIAKEHSTSSDAPAGEEENCPYANSTEEKASSTSFSEEYLHHVEDHYLEDDKLSHDHRHSYDVYIAFHGELISPPPDSFLS
jgi:hypothetical protein